MKRFAIVAALLCLTAAMASAETTSLTGKIVDLATYVTRDHNMDAMHGGAMHGDSMKGDAMHGDSMKGGAVHASCPEVLGLISSAGKAYVLATQMGSHERDALCKFIGKTKALKGTMYTQAGMTVFLVASH